MIQNEIQKNLSLDEKIRLFNGVGSWETYTASGKIPHFFMSDGPHGLRKQEAENYRDLNKSNLATCFPTASCIASSWDPEATYELGQALGAEAKAEKVNLVLGPGMNIKRSPLCGRNFEYFSEDPYLTARMAAAYVNGIQNRGVGACVKHYACNQQEKRRQTSSSNVDEKTLRKIYLPAFEYVIKNANPAAVMCSYNKVNGTYTCHNRHLLTEILRDEWKYEGPVISDWGACIDASKCIKAGMDLAMPDSFGNFETQLKLALGTKKITEDDLNRANGRLLNMIEKYKTNEDKPAEPIDYKEHHAIALKLAEQSAVLLKNDGVLPIKKEEQNILVIGELAEKMKFQGGGSSHITTAEYPNAIESLKSTGFSVTYEPGYFSGFCKRNKAHKKNSPLIEKAILAAKNAKEKDTPILVFAGLTDAFEGEGFDRKDLNLPEEQIELITKLTEISDKVILVTFSGAPIDLSPAKNAAAILHMYLCGQACGEAVADLLTGKANPSGKLAETWPLKLEDNPSFGHFALEGDDVDYTEGELVGYRWYENKNLPVQYEFGYGLSYTSFEISTSEKNISFGYHHNGEVFLNKLILSQPLDSISVKVKNTGTVPGAEVVQCYYNGELCGFQKIYLEPQDEKTISIKIEIYTVDENLIKNKPVSHIEELKEIIETSKFHIHHSLGDMAQECFRIRFLLKIIEQVLALMNHKSKDDPSVKIEISAIYENPLESLISTSGGIITEKFAKRLLKWANTASKKRGNK